ncbi:MAG: caspase family protein, partial [Deltaproteobacteria bacterium]|nr:caspase family protein [Deltaproteobacteria bacterium]
MKHFESGAGQMSSRVKIRITTVLLVLWLCPALVSTSLAQSCGAKGDWKDINILPTNANSDANIKITISADRYNVNPGDSLTLTFRANKDCYLTIMDMGTSGRIIRLWPNEYSGQNNFVPANSPRSFPSPADGFKYAIAGPNGVERIIAYATTEKGKILSEQEFQQLHNTGFKQYSGGAKDLAITFDRRVNEMTSGTGWGTAQVNVCIGRPSVTPPVQGESGKIYLLAVSAPVGKLKYCDRDAQRFTDAMIAKMGVLKSNVKMLLGTQATYDAFASGLEWLASKTQPEDSAVVYFSGHGTSVPDQPPLDEEDERDEAFVVYHVPDRRIDYVEAIQRKIIMVDDDFNVRLKRIPARKKILVADCCHSGTIHKSFEDSSGTVVPKYYPLDDPVTGKEMLFDVGIKAAPTNYGNDHEAILAACRDDQQSYELPGIQSGLFTHHLVTAIQAGAADLEAAFQAAREATEKESTRIAQASQGKMKAQNPCLTDPH